MKKLFLSLLLGVSFFFMSGFITLAEEYPSTLMKLTYTSHEMYYENPSTYEYYVYYRVPVYVQGLPADIEYFLLNNINLSFQKGTNRNTNSYHLSSKSFEPGYTTFRFIITVEKTIIQSYFTNPYDVRRMFDEFTAIYVYHEGIEEEYNRGYLEGYNKGLEDGFNDGYQVGYRNGKEVGFDEGYLEGYNDGILDAGSEAYNRGYEEGYNKGFNEGASADYKQGYKDGSNDKFLNDIAKWFGPMVLIVLIAGAYVSLRNRGRDD